MPHSHRPLTGGLLVVALVGGLLGVNGSTAGAADTSPPALSAGWLETLNWYRTASGMKTVSLDSTLAKSIESHLKLIKEAINGDDADAIQKSLEESIPKFLPLMDIAQKAEAEKQTAQPEVTPGDTAKTESKDDNIVDAEFTEKKD